MPRNTRRVAFNFKKRGKRRDARPNVYVGPVPTEDGTPAPEPARQTAGATLTFAARPARVRTPRQGTRARGAVYTEYLKQELVKFGVVTTGLVVAVILVAIFLD
ncbi:MAG: hypothetical protein HY678_08565 [Chloroflexi bacterium]|nr:hypothetical protein [Chloroflexota bacterium]